MDDLHARAARAGGEEDQADSVCEGNARSRGSRCAARSLWLCSVGRLPVVWAAARVTRLIAELELRLLDE